MHYFSDFRDQSAQAFESFGFEQALRRAADEAQHGRVLVARDDASDYILADYYAPMLLHPPRVVVAQRADMKPGDVLIFRDPHASYPALHEGLPEGSMFVVQRYDQQ